MGLFSDTLREFAPADQAPAQQTLPEAASAGLRSGTYGAGAQLAALTSTAAEAAGAADLAKAAKDKTKAWSLRAQEEAPQIASTDDVHSVGDAVRFAAGVIGQSAPVMGATVGAGLLTSGGAVPAMLAGTAAALPFEAGDVAQRQMLDPALAAKPASDRLATALTTGGGSAALQSVVPGIVAGKVLGNTAAKAAKATAGGIIGRAAGDMALEGLTEGGGELVKQHGTNPDAPTDWRAVKENTLAGFAAGAPLAGLGAAGEVLHGGNTNVRGIVGRAADSLRAAPGQVKEAVSGAYEAGKDAVQGVDLGGIAQSGGDAIAGAGGAIKGAARRGIWAAKDAARTAGDAAMDAGREAGQAVEGFDLGSRANGVIDTLADLGRSGADAIGRMARGETFSRPDMFKGPDGAPLDGDALKAAMAREADAAMQAASGYAKELYERATTPEMRADIEARMQNMGDKANQAWVAAQRMAQTAKDEAAYRVAKLRAAFGGADGDIIDTDAREVPDPKPVGRAVKKSADYSGVDEVVRNTIAPYLRKHAPGLLDDEHLPTVSAALRQYLSRAMAGKDSGVDETFSLIGALGGHASEVVERVRQALPTTDPDKLANYFAAAERLRNVEAAQSGLVELMRRSLTEGPDSVSPTQLHNTARELVKWASTSRSDKSTSAEQALHDRRVRAAMQQYFGNHTERVLDAVERVMPKPKTRLERDGRTVDNEEADSAETMGADGADGTDYNDRLNEGTIGSRFRVMAKNMTLAEEHDPGKHGYELAAVSAMRKAKAKYGEARNLTADDLGEDHPAVERKILELEKRGMAAGLSMEEARQYAREEIDKYVIPGREVSDSALTLTPDEIYGVRLNTHKHSRSSSRIHLDHDGITAVDAVRLTALMRARAAKESGKRVPELDAGEAGQKYDARMFAEGLAALSQAAGRSVEVGPDTVINKSGLTWGKAQRLLRGPKEFAKGDQLDVAAEQAISDMPATYLYKAKQRLEAQLEEGQESSTVTRSLELIDRELEKRNADPSGYQNETRDGIPMNRASRSREGVPGNPGLSTTDPRQAALRDMRAALAGIGRDAPGYYTLAAQIEKMDEMIARDAMQGTGRREVDPFGPTHDALRGRGELGVAQKRKDDPMSVRVASLGGMDQNAQIRTNSDGAARNDTVMGRRKPATSVFAEPDEQPHVGRRIIVGRAKAEAGPKLTPREKFDAAVDRRVEWVQNPPQEYSADTNREIVEWAKSGISTLTEMMRREEPGSDMHDEIRDRRFRLEALRDEAQTVLDRHEDSEAYDEGEGSPDPKAAAAKKAAFLERARSGDKALIEEVSTTSDAKGLQRAIAAMAASKVGGKVWEAATARMSELLANPDVAYGMQTKKYSMEGVDPNASGPRDVRAAMEHIKRVLGDSVTVNPFAGFMHAGEFERVMREQGGFEDVIRISVHALNPTSVAYHESLHAFFAKLTDQGNGRIIDVLEEAANSPAVMLRLRELLKGSPDALAQLSDREERAAYMYQFWASGHLKLGGEPASFFGKVAQFVRQVLGIWSNDDRALHIMEYFHRGEFAANMRSPSAVASALMGPGRNTALEAFSSMAAPLRDLGEKLAVAGHQRLRDTGIPALKELADAMKLDVRGTGDDVGFIPAARSERGRVMNGIASALHGISREDLAAGLEALQRGDRGGLTGGAGVTYVTVRRVLDNMHAYMTEAGVRVGDLGLGANYFPRVWDVPAILDRRQQFEAMLKRNGYDNAAAIVEHLTSADGNEFLVRDKPGMQFLKERKLADISGEDAAPFLNKNLYETLNSYVTQATRRAEWTRRFGEDSERLTELLKRAQEEGATPKDITVARKFMQAVDGTLGDDVNPEWRRMQGNMMVYQNLRLLPLAIFSSVVDPLGVAVRGGEMRDAWNTFKRGVTNVVKGFKEDPDVDPMEELAATIGTIESTTLAHTLGTSFSQGMVGDRGRKINDWFFRWNLMERFNVDMRVGATEAALRFLNRHADGDRNEHSARWLNELGLRPGEVIRKSDGTVAVTEADGLTPEQATKMRAAVNRWVDGAVLRPDAADKPLWMSDPHYAIVAHLKQFTFSFQETILKRVLHEAAHDNMRPALMLASYVPAMIAADLTKGLIQGGGSEPAWKRDWGPGDYVWSGMERAGLFGVGQFGVDALQDIREGGIGVSMLAGPTLEQLGDAVQTVAGRERFSDFALHAMPANALYAGLVGGSAKEARMPD